MLARCRKNGRVYQYARIALGITDRDVAERAAGLFGTSVHTARPYGASQKTTYKAILTGTRAVALMRELYPQMGHRRQGQIDRVLEYEETRRDPNEARREWSSAAAATRGRDARGRLVRG